MFTRPLGLNRHLHTTLRVFTPVSPSQSSPLETSLRNGLKEAMKSRNRPATTTLKTILADITYTSKSSPDPSKPLSQERVLYVLRKGIKQRSEAALSYSPTSQSPHPENYSNLSDEISLLKSYLPPAPSDTTVRGMIDDIISTLDEDVRLGKGAAGNVMKLLWERLGEDKGLVDKKEVGKWVQEGLKKI
ncbi:hypothetical protein TREMEDRAFT_68982 [Tremella mesenterica DSM 1558]|uniref:uncharacterized protein n=1 Tax=Tremella mesenterica (strain ATCC 24925 / CBS 8224 / DSM 1558 / NBRC 9311 / NRRL Y-6157 / RJB 2259-6 / UBC 559-6) TaxID=578456 RepID=UPI0003F498A1|nr:uncharacterized protein TREMEDRAFT_68982 [Tremella mesenterica DSM 1558]EIW69130.1 hypothetical protein TREMEDRAFT_68982 [Tremella mesenterica DSM 1558]